MKAFERKRRVSNTRKMGLAGAGAVLAAASTAQAGTILSPTAVVSNSMGEFDSQHDIGNVIDQSGLSGGFTSGTTDYSDYLLTSPTHVAASKGGSPWLSNNGNTTGSIVFDLGGFYSIERLAIWQGGSTGGGGISTPRNINGITLEMSTDSAFTSPFAAGSFNVPQDASVSAYPVRDFDLTDSVGRYVRLNITSNHGDPGLTRFGEIAFDVNAVPEPSSCFLLLAAGIAVIVRNLRRRLA